MQSSCFQVMLVVLLGIAFLPTAICQECGVEVGSNWRGTPDDEDVTTWIDVLDATECSELCELEPLCEYWVLVPTDDNTCYLKKNYETKSPVTGVTSGLQCEFVGVQSAAAILGSYPGEEASGVHGTVIVEAVGGTLTITGTISLLPADTVSGFHIHSGFSCDTTTEVGDHWYDGTLLEDPWATKTYSSDSAGIAEVRIAMSSTQLGYEVLDSLTHTVVVHGPDGKIACGVLGGGTSSGSGDEASAGDDEDEASAGDDEDPLDLDSPDHTVLIIIIVAAAAVAVLLAYKCRFKCKRRFNC